MPGTHKKRRFNFRNDDNRNQQHQERIYFTVADTADWPTGELYYDIQMTDDAGIITSSETVTINVTKDVTHE